MKFDDQLHLTQTKYIHILFTKYGLTIPKPLKTPMVSKPILLKVKGQPLDDHTCYKCVVGDLQYFLFTKPEITYVVNRLYMFLHTLIEVHWQAAKRILCYPKCTFTHGLFIHKSNEIGLIGFTYSNWASF